MPISSSDRTAAPTERNTPSDGSRKLAEEYSSHIFQIETDRGGGTGFRSPDGKIVTSLHVISGNSEIFAAIDGKRYRVGKNVQIDDINDLAVMEFVDSPPSTNKPLSLAKAPPVAEQPITAVGRPGKELVQSGVEFKREIKQEDYRSLFGRHPAVSVATSTKELSDALLFANRPLLELSKDVSYGMSGGPVIANNGEVVGVTVLGNWSNAYAIPVEKVIELLGRKPEESKFVVTSGYENGLQKYVRDWERAPGIAAETTVVGAGTVLGLAAVASRMGPPSLMMLAPGVGYRTMTDLSGFHGSTNNLDRTYYAAALAADAFSVGGTALCAASYFSPRLRPIGIAMTTAGLAGRLGCELLPNHFVIQRIQRRDGDPRKPFLPAM